MLTPEQKLWLRHLSDDRIVKIVPFDPTVEVKFQKLKKHVQDTLGNNISIVHRGSTSLGISGQDEIDVYIPVLGQDMEVLQSKLEQLFGEPRAIYPLQRIRFVTFIDDKHIDLFLINKEHRDWTEGVAFESYCKDNPETLGAYQKLKEEMNGSTMQEFYQRKNEFIDQVLKNIANK